MHEEAYSGILRFALATNLWEDSQRSFRLRGLPRVSPPLQGGLLLARGFFHLV